MQAQINFRQNGHWPPERNQPTTATHCEITNSHLWGLKCLNPNRTYNLEGGWLWHFLPLRFSWMLRCERFEAENEILTTNIHNITSTLSNCYKSLGVFTLIFVMFGGSIRGTSLLRYKVKCENSPFISETDGGLQASRSESAPKRITLTLSGGPGISCSVWQ